MVHQGEDEDEDEEEDDNNNAVTYLYLCRPLTGVVWQAYRMQKDYIT